MSSRRRSLLVALLAAPAMWASSSGAGAPEAPEVAPDAWRIERTERRIPLEGRTRVTVANPWGDVRVRDDGEDEIYLLTIVQRHRDDPRALEAAVEADGTSTRIVVGSTGELPGSESPGFARRRVDVTLFVPSGTRLAVETRDGLAEVRGVGAPVSIETVRGDIRARLPGPLHARSEHGAVDVAFRSTDWPEGSSIETVTGPIQVLLPTDGAAEVGLETRGEIATDYSIRIERRPGSTLKVGTASIGEGGPALKLASYQGAVHIQDGHVPAAGGQEAGE